jgi:hypothetical protein
MEAVDRRTSEIKNVLIVGPETYTPGNGPWIANDKPQKNNLFSENKNPINNKYIH